MDRPGLGRVRNRRLDDLDASTRLSMQAISAKPHLVLFLACLALLWGLSWCFDRDAYYYVMALVGAAVIALKWQGIHAALMPRWLKVLLWIPLAMFLAELAYLALFKHR